MDDNTLALTIARRARELLPDQSKWIKGGMAATKDRMTYVDIEDSRAECFCTVGAITRAMMDVTGELRVLPGVFLRSIPVPDVLMWNDHPAREFFEVEYFFKTLIKNIEEEMKNVDAHA